MQWNDEYAMMALFGFIVVAASAYSTKYSRMLRSNMRRFQPWWWYSGIAKRIFQPRYLYELVGSKEIDC
jgi:hypothetical protein